MMKHHAQLMVGDPVVSRVKLESEFKEFGPDLFIHFPSRWQIGDSRLISDLAHQRSKHKDEKYFILGFEQPTLEAQNALLKTLEEPPPGTYFFLLVRDVRCLLSTLLSRCHIVIVKSEKKVIDSTLAKEFLRLDKTSRLEFVKDYDEPTKLVQAIAALSSKIDARFVLRAEKWLAQPATAPRLILEYLSIILPQYDL